MEGRKGERKKGVRVKKIGNERNVGKETKGEKYGSKKRKGKEEENDA